MTTLDPDSVFLPLTRQGVDPVPELAGLQARGRVTRLDLFGNAVWLVTHHADVRAVLGDTVSYSNDFAHLGGEGAEELDLAHPGGLGFRDPPDHTRLRRMLAPAFTARRLAALAPRVEQVVAGRLDALERAGSPADLVREFATPVPALVIGELLGVSAEDQDAFAALSAGRFDLLSSMMAPLDNAAGSLDFLGGLVARERRSPGPGLLGELIRTHGDDVDDVELAGLADGLLVGGHETTASMLALGVLLLLRDPERARLVREEPAAVDAAVEELLRYLTVVQVAFPRFAREDVVLAGQPIAAGDLVLCSLVAADRDPALGPGLDRLELRREPTQHMAFGFGIHHCLGAPLARMELRQAFPALLRRLPRLRLAVPEQELRFSQRSIVFGLEDLPVAW